MSTTQTGVFSLFNSEMTLESFINNFHFIRPAWFIALIALFLLLFILKKIRYYQSPWQHFLPEHLSKVLLENSTSSNKTLVPSKGSYWVKPFIIGTCIIVALAGPAWQKLPQPVYQLERGAVLIMDMSYSMYSTDVKPNRLTRARYKAIDLLNHINEGDVGLIAYAGDAFIISPLTQDVKNIELLLPSLSPDIMPVHGANALAALTLADQTLKNAGHVSGDIYWLTDDIDNEEMSDVYDWAEQNNHSLNILGVGTQNGAPIKLTSGKLLKDNRGAIVVPKLPEHRLSAITKRSRGSYHSITNDESDIKALTAHLNINLEDKLNGQPGKETAKNEQADKQALQGDQYQEEGPWLLLVMLPFVLSYFRRGTSILTISWLLPLTLTFSLLGVTPTSYANNNVDTSTIDNTSAVTQSNQPAINSASSFWRNLWKTPDQQAQQHFDQEQYQQAAKQFENSQWQGSAHYKAGEYEQALQAFKQDDSAQSLYNQGNAHAHLQQVDEAINAYKEALKKDPGLSDAQDNLDKLEALKKQQEQSKENSQQGESQDSEQNEQQQSQDNSQESQDQSQQSQSDEQQNEQQDNQTSQDQQQNQQEQNDSKEQKSLEDKQSQQEEQQEQEQEAESARENKNEQQNSEEEKTLAQQATDSKKQETDQKHQQLLNKVTDDPYLLLRNKMRIEYQKRRNEGDSQRGNKKW